MKRVLLSLLLVVLIITTSCDSEVPYTELESGVAYKYIENAEGKKPSQGEILSMDMISVYGEDSVLLERVGNQKLLLDPFAVQVEGVKEVLTLCGEGDSVHIRMTWQTYADLTRSPFTPVDPTKDVVMRLRVTNVETQNDLVARLEKEQTAADAEIIQKYIADKGLEATEATEGINQVVLEEGDGPKPVNGQTVSVNYTVRLTDGTLIDTSDENAAKEAGQYNEARQYEPYPFVLGTGNVIAGWHKGIPFVNKGGKSIMIIPSRLAYGPRGRQGIAPNTVLVFDLVVVDIK